MKIYLAGRWSRYNFIRSCAVELRNIGFEVVSTWHDEARSANLVDDETMRQCAIRAVNQINRCTIFVYFANPRYHRYAGGAEHSEYAHAIVNGCTVLHIGERTQLWHWLPDVTVLDSWSECKAQLQIVGQAPATIEPTSAKGNGVKW